MSSTSSPHCDPHFRWIDYVEISNLPEDDISNELAQYSEDVIVAMLDQFAATAEGQAVIKGQYELHGKTLRVSASWDDRYSYLLDANSRYDIREHRVLLNFEQARHFAHGNNGEHVPSEQAFAIHPELRERISFQDLFFHELLHAADPDFVKTNDIYIAYKNWSAVYNSPLDIDPGEDYLENLFGTIGLDVSDMELPKNAYHLAEYNFDILYRMQEHVIQNIEEPTVDITDLFKAKYYAESPRVHYLENVGYASISHDQPDYFHASFGTDAQALVCIELEPVNISRTLEPTPNGKASHPELYDVITETLPVENRSPAPSEGNSHLDTRPANDLENIEIDAIILRLIRSCEIQISQDELSAGSNVTPTAIYNTQASCSQDLDIPR